MNGEQPKHARVYIAAAWALVLVAVALRVGLYFRNRALWLDEAMLALNVVDRGFGELLQSLDYNQSAPLGFLLAIKLATLIFGDSDWVLRAVPLAAGVAAAPLFLLAAQRALVTPLPTVRTPTTEDETTRADSLPQTVPPQTPTETVVDQGEFVLADAESSSGARMPTMAATAPDAVRPVAPPSHAITTYTSNWPAVLYALALFTVSFPLVRYASEFKQYAFDLAAASAMIWLAVRVWSEPTSLPRAATFAIAGVSLLWFSHPLVFVLAALGLVTLTRFVVARNGRASLYVIAVGVLWVLSFGLSYLASLRHYAGDAELTAWWEHAFLPFPPRSPADVKWYVWTFIAMFEHPLGLLLPGLGALGFLIGCVALARTRPWVLALVLAPLLIPLVASALRLYPFTERFIIFLAPSLLIATGAGIQQLVNALWPHARLAAVLVIALIFLQPALVVANELARPGDPGVRPELAILAESDGPIYVYHWAQYEARYYAPAYNVDPERFIIGSTARNDWNHYRQELNQLRGKPKVWFLFVDIPFFLGRNEEQYLLTMLEKLGSRTAEHRSPRARLYRYDLSSEEPSAELPEASQ